MASWIFKASAAPDTPQSCQTCAKVFKSESDLRHHLAHYQLEEQRLVNRLLEIQAHLPPEHQLPKVHHEHHGVYTCQTCFESFTSGIALDRHIAEYQGEQQQIVAALPHIHGHSAWQSFSRVSEEVSSNGDLGDDDGNDISHAGERCDADTRYNGRSSIDKLSNSTKRKRPTGTEMICPHPECHDKQRRFANLTLLHKHFQIHVSCLDICVYCRDISTKVSSARRHDCENRQRIERNEQARQSSRTEIVRANRHKQLARQSQQEMNWLLRHRLSKPRRKTLDSGEFVPQKPCMKTLQHGSGSNDTEQGRNIFSQDNAALETQPSHLQPNQMPAEWKASNVDVAEYAGIFLDAALPPFYSLPPSIPSTALPEPATNYPITGEYASIFLHGPITPLYSTAPQ